EFTIRVLVVIILIVIAFVVFVALISVWGGESSGMLKGLQDWFKQILSGGVKPPTGSSTGLPGIPATGGNP
ncbi:MAG: hypothetical protein NTY20_05495, partial [Candidatus Aenigmarchaeota archaeon]|nr:hypothetical protein [Candidatus Aenigmarchaeota archaeon]